MKENVKSPRRARFWISEQDSIGMEDRSTKWHGRRFYWPNNSLPPFYILSKNEKSRLLFYHFCGPIVDMTRRVSAFQGFSRQPINWLSWARSTYKFKLLRIRRHGCNRFKRRYIRIFIQTKNNNWRSSCRVSLTSFPRSNSISQREIKYTRMFKFWITTR